MKNGVVAVERWQVAFVEILLTLALFRSRLISPCFVPVVEDTSSILKSQPAIRKVTFRKRKSSVPQCRWDDCSAGSTPGAGDEKEWIGERPIRVFQILHRSRYWLFKRIVSILIFPGVFRW